MQYNTCMFLVSYRTKTLATMNTPDLLGFIPLVISNTEIRALPAPFTFTSPSHD